MPPERDEEKASGTWLELPAQADASITQRGLRAASAVLIYIGSAENGFADAGRTFPLTGYTKVQLGRIAGDGLVATTHDTVLDVGIPIPWVSGAHAELELQARESRGPAMRLIDLGSRNGTAIEGRRLEGGADLNVGELFEAGRSFWMVRDVLEGTPPAPTGFEPTSTANPTLARIYRNLERLARTRMPLLVVGETGTGKDYLAQAVHRRSGRTGNFVKVNLVGLSMGELVMGEAGRPGLLQEATGGTVYVDELGALERDAQTKLGALLSYADEDEGGRGDLRIVASSSRDLRELVDDGKFRADLYARLAHYETRLPPLRERREDLGLLVRALAARGRARPLKLETGAFRRILGHAWPFNVRELRQALGAVAALTDEDGVITAGLLAEVLRRDASLPSDPAQLQALREDLVSRLTEHRGAVDIVARGMGRSEADLRRMLQQLHLEPELFAERTSQGGATLVDMRHDAVARPDED
jgi:hypothetical protein